MVTSAVKAAGLTIFFMVILKAAGMQFASFFGISVSGLGALIRFPLEASTVALAIMVACLTRVSTTNMIPTNPSFWRTFVILCLAYVGQFVLWAHLMNVYSPVLGGQTGIYLLLSDLTSLILYFVGLMVGAGSFVIIIQLSSKDFINKVGRSFHD